MQIAVRWALLYPVFLAAIAPGKSRAMMAAGDQPGTHSATVADAIAITQLADPLYVLGGSAKDRVAKFSPDGQRFTILTKKGNLKTNSNQYSLLLFSSHEMFRSPRPLVLATFSSTSNRPAIKNVKWITNELIAFLGERPHEIPQVFQLDCRTKVLRRITNHSAEIVSFDLTERGTLAFVAKTAGASPARDESGGFLVTTQRVAELAAGHYSSDGGQAKYQLWVKAGNKGLRAISISDEIYESYGEAVLSLSHDGRYALVQTRVRNEPEIWKQYEDPLLKRAIGARFRPHGAAVNVPRYALVDIMKGSAEPLLNSPANYLNLGYAWAPDSRSVVVSGTFLPLDVPDQQERLKRRTQKYVVEVEVPSRRITKVSGEDLKLLRWIPFTNRVLLESDPLKRGPRVLFEKRGSEWAEAGPFQKEAAGDYAARIVLREDFANPPKIFAVDPAGRQSSLLLDLNPQFEKLRLGKIESFMWTAADGHEVEGSLYLPPGYSRDKRYPLVIQTHGFSPDRFWFDGPWSTGFAAEPLASRDIVVLQVGLPKDVEEAVQAAGTPREAPRAMSEYEGAIDKLDSLQFIDRNRIGIIGFSRTCFHVKYALTHSQYKFTAAAIADGTDGGYVQYLLSSTSSAQAASEFEGVNGGVPYGPGLKEWIGRSPSFRLNTVTAPVRIQAIGAGSVLFEWEWFAGLSILRRPVEMIVIPNGQHLLVKPEDRLLSQEGNVDWFDFWLNGHEDPDPTKAEQYARWRDLRKLQEANTGSQKPN